MNLDIATWYVVWFFAGVPLVELSGYFWHRLVEHNGGLGNRLRYNHYVHHELHYPAESLRSYAPEEYKDANDWSWYVLAAVVFAAFGILAATDALPIGYILALGLGAVAYARYVVSVFHDLYHIEDPSQLPAKRLFPFGGLLRSVYLRLFRSPRFQKKYKKLLYLHDLHHLERCNYGIVFFWADRLFGTFREKKAETAINVFPGFDLTSQKRPEKS